MEFDFKDPKLERLYTDSAFTGGYPAAIVRLFRMRVQIIDAAPDERDFYALKSLHFEQLKGDRAGQYSMRLNKQWRLILEFKKSPKKKTVVVIRIEDYH